MMMRSLETHVNNLSELYVCNCSNKRNQQVKIKYDHKYIYSGCKSCTKRSKQSHSSLKNKFPNTYHLANGSIKKFKLLLKKGVYPYEYMNDRNKFNETELPTIGKFYSELNLKNISNDGFKHAQNVWNTLILKM